MGGCGAAVPGMGYASSTILYRSGALAAFFRHVTYVRQCGLRIAPPARVKRALFVLVGAVALGACSSGGGAGTTESADTGAPASWNRTVTRPASEADAATGRAGCMFGRGSLPAETLGPELPVADGIPIKTIVVLMQENRSFDSYFGRLGKFMHRTDIESPPDDASNPERVGDPNSPRHPLAHAPYLCSSDMNHEWAGTRLSYNGGKMDGFFQANHMWTDPTQPQVSDALSTGDRALWWYDERDIPFYYDLASTFAIGDHYHASVLGPTYPNRDYLYAATSLGVTDDRSANLAGWGPEKDLTIFDMLERRHVTWAIYVDSFPHIPRVGALLGSSYMSRWPSARLQHMSDFNDQAAAGTLPQVVFVDASINEGVDGNDEHPPADIQTGESFVSDVVHALMTSPQWKDLALFFTYDEHGGLYDHVAPPTACAPDRGAPDFRNNEDRAAGGGFDRLGMRVPFVVVSPWAKKSYVSHQTYDHTSITRFIEAKFTLPALTHRDANALPPYDMFDFSRPTFAAPPRLRAAEIDPRGLETCRTFFTPPQRNGGGGQ